MSRTRGLSGDATTASLSRTPGHLLASSHATSGYMGDNSTNVTKSRVKQPPAKQLHLEKRELSTPTRAQSYDKKLKLAEEEEEMEDEEPTGMFGDMMAEFKQGLGAPMGRMQEDRDTSLQVSI